MNVRLWGTRGSVPSSGPAHRYGGNTSCLEVRLQDGTLIILDAGTGIRALGAALGDAEGHILLSHYHWDHIQGLPFFEPAYSAASSFQIFGPEFEGKGPDVYLHGQLEVPYFPNPEVIWPGISGFHTLHPGDRFTLGGATITAGRSSHPQMTLGYRIEEPGCSLVYLCDNEVDVASPEMLASIVALARGADLLIHDCQYTEGEYATRQGWGHSTPRQVAQIAAAAGVKKVMVFHHDPSHQDDQVEALAAEVRERGGRAFEVVVAGEGEVIGCEISTPL